MDRRPRVAIVRLLLVGLLASACGSQNGTASPAIGGASQPATAPVASDSPSPSSEASPAPSPSAAAIAGGGSSTAQSLEQNFEAVVQQVGPSVVLIETSEGLGSGVVLDAKGDIVTNAHVAGTSKSFQVVAADGTRLNGTLVGTFPSDDIAVINVSGGNLKPATFANSDQLKVGEIVLAIGNPLGLQSSVTDGIVSAVGRTVNEPGGVALPGVIQTSAAINPGNSGGALVDLDGQVVGIPTLTATDPQIGGAAVGIGFAVPSNIARDIGTQLVQNGKVVNSHRAYLGVRLASVMGADGVLVYSVESGGPAAKAGIPSDVLITKLDDQATPDQPTLAAILAGLEPGQTVSVTIEHRDGTTETKQVTLGELPG